MNGLESFVQIVVVVAATVLPVVATIRFVAGHDHGQPVVRPATWPRGVQEEEPQPWRLGTAS